MYQKKSRSSGLEGCTHIQRVCILYRERKRDREGERRKGGREGGREGGRGREREREEGEKKRKRITPGSCVI